MPRLVSILVASLLAFAAVSKQSAHATTLIQVEGQCPVCGRKLVVHKIASTNNFGGRDRDFCEHAAGEQPLMVTAHTCHHCLFSGYPEDFSREIRPEVKELILGGGALQPAGDLSRPWVRHDLIAQRLVLEGAPAETLGEQYLQTSWAVRLDPRGALGERAAGLSSDDHAWFRLQLLGGKFVVQDGKDRAAIEMAEAASSHLAELPIDRARTAALISARLLRARGENPILLALLPRLQHPFRPEEWQPIEQDIRGSIHIERRYQRLALGAFRRALSQPDSLSGERRAVLTYLSGELLRRLGDNEGAGHMFDEASAKEGAPDWVRQWSREQRGLAGRRMR